jgi:transmembrane sensor
MSVEIEIHELIVNSLKGKLTPADQTQLAHWIEQSPQNKAIFDQLSDADEFSHMLSSLEDFDESGGWNIVKSKALGKKRFGIRSFQLSRIAAVVFLICLLSGTFFVIYRQLSSKNQLATSQSSTEIQAPRLNKAILKLADGRELPLDSISSDGQLLGSSVKLTKANDGTISYQALDNRANSPLLNNTIYNPKGSTVVDLVLSDGTKVWLNAGSSITFPIVFVGDSRKVSVVGEAYFEVVRNPRKPFYVEKDDVSISVLGTAFNMNAYDNEINMKVTLVYGKVSISKSGMMHEVVLKQAQQASIGNDITIHDDVDLESVIAWKNGYFSFYRADIKAVMRQVERWYDVEVDVGEKYGDRRFTGEISRMSSVSKVLEVLKESDIHFKVEGKKITITK